MTIQHAHKHLRQVGGPRSTQRTILLTGASGVLGQALLPRLAGNDVVCLTHRRPVDGASLRSVRGDLTRPGLALYGGVPRREAEGFWLTCSSSVSKI